jgi:two-component system KDP operon response regulator KdpE
MTALPAIGPILTASTARATVLVVDDDDATVKILALVFERAGARVIAATSGGQALRQTFEQRPDVVVLDLTMPEMDGLTVCRRLRELSDVPIIMITAFDGIDNVTNAFAAGVDDFVAKPFDTSELLARVQACLRRLPQNTENDDSLVLGKGDLVIDLRRHSIWVRQRTMHLTRTEFELLVYLARNRGRILTHDILKSAIWGDAAGVGHDSLKQFIGALRKKIELDSRHPQWLVSEHGVGYALLVD